MSRRASQLLALGLLAGLTSCVEKKEPIFVTSIGPNLPSFLTLPSGHAYTLLQTGPLVGKEGKVLGWRIAFLSPESDPAVLEANAKELLEFARADPEAAGFPAVIVFAVLSFDPETRRDMHYGIGMVGVDSPATHGQRRVASMPRRTGFS